MAKKKKFVFSVNVHKRVKTALEDFHDQVAKMIHSLDAS